MDWTHYNILHMIPYEDKYYNFVYVYLLNLRSTVAQKVFAYFTHVQNLLVFYKLQVLLLV